MSKIEIIELVKKAQSVAGVLEQHGVFGFAPSHLSDENRKDALLWIAHQSAEFVSKVVRQGLDPSAENPLLMKYPDSLAMLVLDVEVQDGVAKLSTLNVTPRPDVVHVAQKIDYAALEADLQPLL